MSAHVWEILDRKGRNIISVPGSTNVLDAVRTMTDHNIGCVLVMSEAGEIDGICSERDVFRKVILQEKNPGEVEVSAVMTPGSKVVTVHADTTLTECMDLMTKQGIRHLPVLNASGKAEAMISLRDVVDVLSSEKELMIRQLEHYIGSSL